MPRARNAAVVLALLVAAVGWTRNTRVAGGADSYGYVSQATLWREGRLTVDQSFVRDVPWPLAAETFAPLGYRPSADGLHLVPIYSPGLPMLMAAAQVIAGPNAAFVVVPLAGAVLVFATFATGRRLGGDFVGLSAASIVATSPTLLYMIVQPMSDVPAAAAWATSIACLLARTAASGVAAGVATSAAILIRPNLAPIAIVLAVWAIARRGRGAWPFVVCACVGPAIVAVINARLHGSPFASGYDLTEGFSLAYVGANVRRYGAWLLAVEPAIAIGLAGIVIHARARTLFVAIVAVVFASYFLYVPWDAWWYLRFLLPAWPILAVGAALLVQRTGRAAIPIVVAIAVLGVWQAARRDAFALARAEQKYVDVAKAVSSATSPHDVILAKQHSGSLRYYANRLTLRWDVMDPRWLDRAVDWCTARHEHVFIVLDADEIAAFRERLAAASAIGRLDWPPIIRVGGVQIFDAIARDPRTQTTNVRER